MTKSSLISGKQKSFSALSFFMLFTACGDCHCLGSVGPNPHFTLASYVLHAQKHRPQAIKKIKKKKSWWHFSPLWNQKGSSTSIISAKLKGKDEEEKKNTHTHIHSSHHHLHSRFLKSSHISVTIATPPLSPSLFRSCVFFFLFFFNPSHPPLLSLPLSRSRQ